MKKLLAFLLSMIMALSLAIPAFADEPGIIPINGIIGGGDGPTVVYPGSIPDTDEYLAAHPGLEEQLRANAYGYFTEHYAAIYGYESAQEFMETLGMSEEEFLDLMVDFQVIDLISEEYQPMDLKTALGGVPGEISVMVNGTFIPFPDAVPEVTNGRTMAPVRAVVEALGGEISYQDGAVQFVIDGYAYDFEVGSATVTVTPAAGNDKDTPKPDDIIMDCAPYIKGGRTYVPVRFLGEALGYTVGWDGTYETAVLTDGDALAAEIDESFTIINRVLSNQALNMEAGKNYRTDTKGDVTFTAFDTLNGNTTYTASLTAKQLFNTEAINGDYTLTLSDNLAGVLADLLEEEGLSAVDAEAMRAALRKLELNVIMTREGLAWVHSPLLDAYATEDNVWLGMGLDMELVEEAFGSMGKAATIGQTCAMSLETDSILSWRSAAMTAEAMVEVIGDQCFTTSGGVSTLKWDVKDLVDKARENPEETFSEAELEMLSGLYKEYRFTLTVDQKGNAKLSCLLHTLPQHLGDMSLRLSMDCSQWADRSSLTMDLHIANVGQLKLTLDASRQTTTQPPAVQPPEGSNVVDAIQPLNP